jgi:hypothetical protein
MTRMIALTLGQFALVDDADFPLLSVHRWNFSPRSDSGAYATRGCRMDDGRRTTIYMHRQIMDAPRESEVDHVDGDGLNNQRSNLRLCTKSQNIANARFKTSSTGYRGVYLQKRRGDWQAQATVDGKTVNLGTFKDPVEAAKVRDEFVGRLYGDFAILNFPKRKRLTPSPVTVDAMNTPDHAREIVR